MNEFARILSELIDRGKANRQFNIQKLAQETGITASYLSNIKQANRKPPAHKTLIRLTEALQHFGVPATDLQMLIEAYNRTQLESQRESNLLTLLIDAYHEKESFVKRLQRNIQTKSLSNNHERLNQREVLRQEILKSGFIEGDQKTLLSQAAHLFKQAAKAGLTGGQVYATWYCCPAEQELNESLKQHVQHLLETIRDFLWADLSFELIFLCAGGVMEESLLVRRFLEEFLGTSNCRLYELPIGTHLPRYFVIEGFGFIEAKLKSDDHYWIHTMILEEADKKQPNELDALIEHLDYVLHSNNYQPLIQTMASLEAFVVTPGLKKLAEAERKHIEERRQVIQRSFSRVYCPVEPLQTKLQILNLQEDRASAYLQYHRERINTFCKRLEYGEEWAIYSKGLFEPELVSYLKKTFSGNCTEADASKAGVNMIKEQVLQVLKVLTQYSNFHFALTDQEFPLTYAFVGDTAFFGLDLPYADKQPHREHRQLEAIAWTSHPDIIYHLQREFDEKWEAIDKHWRSDTEEGMQNILDFIVIESLKPFIAANAPVEELWMFIQRLLGRASYLDAESFIRELYLQEQVAKDIFIICNSLPLLTMPVSVGPWQPRSAIRIRQRLFESIFKQVESFHIISTQTGIEQYWETNYYADQCFEKNWTIQHFNRSYKLLRESPEKMSIEFVQSPVVFPVHLEIVNQEYVFIEKIGEQKGKGGMVLHDKNFAQSLLVYVKRHFSTNPSKNFQGMQNAIKRFEELLGVKMPVKQ